MRLTSLPARVGSGLSMQEAAAFAPRIHAPNHGITLLMSHLDKDEKANHPLKERQISLFRDLCRVYSGIPGSLANSSGIFLGRKAHFDLVRAGSALFGVNPTPSRSNPMLPVIELRARIVQVRNIGYTAKRSTRLALVSVGYADGYPYASTHKLQVLVGNYRCPVAGHPFMDLLPIDVSDLPDTTAARYSKMATLIGRPPSAQPSRKPFSPYLLRHLTTSDVSHTQQGRSTTCLENARTT